MTIDFTCQKCEGSFELDAQDLTDGTEKLECPHCEAKATTAQVEDFTTALAELQTRIASLSKKFAVTMTIETDDLEDEPDDDEDEDDDVDDDDDEDEDDDDDDDDEDLEEDAEEEP
jgi:hypothetical protein